MVSEEHDLNNAESTPMASGGTSQSAGAPISLDDATIESLASNPKFVDLVERAAQSRHDKRIARIEKELNEAKAAKAKEVGEPVTETPASVPPVTQSELSVSQALKDAGIAPDDPLVNQALAFKREQRGSQGELADYLLEQRAARQNQPPASAASATQTGGSLGNPTTTAADIQNRIDAIQADRLKMMSPEGRKELNDLAVQLQQYE